MPKVGTSANGEHDVASDIFVVPNALEDDRFKDNALVTGWPHVRFYAGAPLRVADDSGRLRAIGTLCAIDIGLDYGGIGTYLERDFGVREKQILMDFGAIAVGVIEQQRCAAQALAMAKSDFISCTAHDIRTPVACFSMCLDFLRDTDLQPEQREVVLDAQLSVEVISETIDRAIEAARSAHGFEQPHARREKVNVRDLLARADALTRALLSDKRAQLVLEVTDDVPQYLITDGALLWRCVLNYVMNALKASGNVALKKQVVVVHFSLETDPEDVLYHTDDEEDSGDLVTHLSPFLTSRRLGEDAENPRCKEGRTCRKEARGCLGLSLPEATRAKAAQRYLRFEVRDRAGGVPASTMPTLFRPFVQAKGAKEGTGLGLYAVKQCAKILGGACGMRERRPRRCAYLTRELKSPPTANSTPLAASETLRERFPNFQGVSMPKDGGKTVADSPASTGGSDLVPGGSIFWLLVPFEASDEADRTVELSPTLSSRSTVELIRSVGMESESVPSADNWQSTRLLSAAQRQSAAPPPAAAAASSSEPSSHPKKRKQEQLVALVVEDSTPIRKMLKRILEQFNFIVDEAGNGEDGLRIMTSKKHDVTIVDFLMPICDGVTCTRRFRAWEKQNDGSNPRKIIGSSANADEADIADAYDAGLDDYVAKPMTRQKLKECLARNGLIVSGAT